MYTSGNCILQGTNIAGDDRTYRVVAPHDTLLPSPLVFAFHGMGDSPESMAEYSELDYLAAKSGFILVYPAAKNSMWSTINLDPANLDHNPDIQFFDQLYSQLFAEFNIATDRVYLVGMSNGASFAHVIATSRSDRISALVAHSGLRPEELGVCDTSIPMMLIAGANDLVAPIMESTAERYQAEGCTVEYIRVPGLGHNWSTQHNSAIWHFLSTHARQR